MSSEMEVSLYLCFVFTAAAAVAAAVNKVPLLAGNLISFLWGYVHFWEPS